MLVKKEGQKKEGEVIMAGNKRLEHRMIGTKTAELVIIERWETIIVMQTGYRAVPLQAFDARFVANTLNEYADKLDPPEEG